MLPTFPISDLLPSIQESINQNDELLLIAPPGAGKTTLVPLELLDGLSESGKIIVIEPRRIAARSAALRMAEILEEPVGETVGFRVRLQTQVSAATKIEVVTEGVFLRMLQADPSLEEISLVIFDEFHERSLNSDLALALTISSKTLFSDLRDKPLKVIVMSATLDSHGLSRALSEHLAREIPVVESPGKSFPVDLIYSDKNYHSADITQSVYSFAVNGLTKTQGDVLVFLPGVGEINKTQDHLNENGIQHYFGPNSVEVLSLHGGLSLEAQSAIVKPKSTSDHSNIRRVILATSIAQTSVTIPGITAVVDSGFVRLPEFDARTTTTRLVTQSVSKATATQRAGRAGRLGPGVCFRMWSEEKDYQLPDFDTPEILSSDLTDLLLQIKSWGIDDIHELFWLDSPPKHLLGASYTLLNNLGGFCNNQLTSLGEQMAALPVSPRIAKMLLVAKALSVETLACDLAAILQDYKNKNYADVNLLPVFEFLNNRSGKNIGRAFSQIKAVSKQLLTLIKPVNVDGLDFSFDINSLKESLSVNSENNLSLVSFLLTQAFPDRIAKQVRGNSYKLANGRGAMLNDSDPLITSQWLIVADVGGQKNQSRDRIYSAVPLSSALLDDALSYLVKRETQIRWDESDGRFVAANISRVGDITLKQSSVDNVTNEQKTQSLMDWIKHKGESAFERFSWDDSAVQWRARVELIKSIDDNGAWPDLSNQGLLNSLDLWLEPYVSEVSNLSQLKNLPLVSQLSSLIDWQQKQQLDEWLPEKIPVPSGSKIAIDYTANPPVLAVKLQEMFGLDQSPKLANGKIPLSIHLLSPARRPLQITQDLAGFWKGSYQEVRKEMKGRYPKHHWPEDPYSVAPTARAKPRKR
ncbi:ATP-dependent helicase HrpB [Sessilibacter corallicola]|uniref:ATP-dependent helicase HrpB n=1 Tax=Sessilibacter corallicola TaxID=2904075 RepID=A0ABQ0A437_9GAMM